MCTVLGIVPLSRPAGSSRGTVRCRQLARVPRCLSHCVSRPGPICATPPTLSLFFSRVLCTQRLSTRMRPPPLGVHTDLPHTSMLVRVCPSSLKSQRDAAQTPSAGFRAGIVLETSPSFLVLPH